MTTVDATINGVTIGMGGGSQIGNTVVGISALYANTTGSNHSTFGYQAAYQIVSTG